MLKCGDHIWAGKQIHYTALFVVNSLSVWYMDVRLKICTLSAVLCFSLSIKVINTFGQCVPSDFCHWQGEEGSTVIQMMMKTRKHPISGLHNDSTFYSLDVMILVVPGSSVFSASWLSLQLKWRLAPEELGLCQVVCIFPGLKREMTVESTELNCALVEYTYFIYWKNFTKHFCCFPE